MNPATPSVEVSDPNPALLAKAQKRLSAFQTCLSQLDGETDTEDTQEGLRLDIAMAKIQVQKFTPKEANALAIKRLADKYESSKKKLTSIKKAFLVSKDTLKGLQESYHAQRTVYLDLREQWQQQESILSDALSDVGTDADSSSSEAEFLGINQAGPRPARPGSMSISSVKSSEYAVSAPGQEPAFIPDVSPDPSFGSLEPIPAEDADIDSAKEENFAEVVYSRKTNRAARQNSIRPIPVLGDTMDKKARKALSRQIGKDKAAAGR